MGYDDYNNLLDTLFSHSFNGESNSSAIFAVKRKEDFNNNGVKGRIVRNAGKLHLLSQSHTHFTPNVFRFGAFTNSRKTHIKGFDERNLKAINTFVIDVDTTKHSLQTILLTCIDDSVGSPTFVIKSPRGYQLYFVLTTPLYITNKNNYRGLSVAKRISRNIKQSLKTINADLFCNDFGFFRMPSRHNVVWTNLNQTYSFKQLIQWSSTFDNGEPLYHSHKEVHNPYLSEWLDALLQIKNVKSQKGQIGRNNTLFSAALVCYQSGLTTDEAHNYMQTLNGRFDTPIDKNEMRSILDSAYSGRYRGAKLDYLKMLLDLYAPDIKHPVSMNGWYKFKKNRIDRVRSHFEEWESDISNYITLHLSEHTPFIWKTQSELCKEIGIPQSTLNALLKKSTTLLKVVKGKGRAAITGWTTRKIFIEYMISITREKKRDYQKYMLIVLKSVQFYENPCYELIIKDMQKLNDTKLLYDTA